THTARHSRESDVRSRRSQGSQGQHIDLSSHQHPIHHTAVTLPPICIEEDSEEGLIILQVKSKDSDCYKHYGYTSYSRAALFQLKRGIYLPTGDAMTHLKLLGFITAGVVRQVGTSTDQYQ
ncbi:hypothetical protein Pmani_013256, partial [Petrolisthes manimaculis]